MHTASHSELTPAQIKRMPLDEFEARFGFRPEDAFEKSLFIIYGEGQMPDVARMRAAIKAGILEEPELSGIVME